MAPAAKDKSKSRRDEQRPGPEELFAKIRRDDEIPPVVILTGKEALRIDDTTAQLAKLAAERYGSKVETLYAAEKSLGQALALARTASLFESKQVVQMRWIHLYSERQTPQNPHGLLGAENAAELANNLERYLERPSRHTILIMSGEPVSGATRVGKAIAKYPDHYDVDFPPAWDNDAKKFTSRAAYETWTKDEARRQGLNLTSDAVSLLVERCGTDLYTLRNTLETLRLGHEAGTRFDASTLGRALPQLTDADMDAAVEAVLYKQPDQLFMRLDQLFADNDKIFPFVARVEARFRDLMLFRSARDAGQSPEEAARTLGWPPGKIRIATAEDQRKRWSTAELTRAMGLIHATSVAIRTEKAENRLSRIGDTLLRLTARAPA